MADSQNLDQPLESSSFYMKQEKVIEELRKEISRKENRREVVGQVIAQWVTLLIGFALL